MGQGVLATCWFYLAKGVDLFIERPLLYTYMHGASLFGLGGYAGRPVHEICSILTDVSSIHWFNHPEECNLLIASKVRSYEVLGVFLLYISSLMYLVLKCTRRALRAAECVCGAAISLTMTAGRLVWDTLRLSLSRLTAHCAALARETEKVVWREEEGKEVVYGIEETERGVNEKGDRSD